MRLLIAVLAVLPLASGLTADNVKPEPPKTETPRTTTTQTTPSPDAQAYRLVSSTKDPEQKIIALEQFLKDFPHSASASSARRELLVALVKVNPVGAVARIKALTKRLPGLEASGLYRTLAAELISSKQLPEEAEKSARKAMKRFQYPAFAADARFEAESRKRPAPGESVIRGRYRVQRAQMTETLAQALLAKGDPNKARKMFELALREYPALGSAALSLADIHDRQGQKEEALRAYAQVMLARPSPESRRRFDAYWLKVKGSAAGEQEFLDRRYKEIFPDTLRLSPYQASSARTNRVVLGEMYTGAGCGPCAGADLAFDAILERYRRSDVAVVMYHQHIPRPDPLSNPDAQARYKWQKERGVPTYAIDGKVIDLGGGSRDGAGDIVQAVLQVADNDLETAPGVDLSLIVENDGRAVRASTSVSRITRDPKDLLLNIILVEKEVRYSGENGIRFHPMVARAIATIPLRELKGTKLKSETRVFKLDEVSSVLENHLHDFEKHDDRYNDDGSFRFMEHTSGLDPKGLAVVAFVQDERTREVLQAVYVEAPKS